MPNKVIAIRKLGGAQNTHEHITDIKYTEEGTAITYQQTVAQVISAIDRNVKYYVSRGGRSIPVTTGSKNGVRHIKTEPDDTLVDNLLSLPTF